MNSRAIRVLRFLAIAPARHRDTLLPTGLCYAHVSGALISLSRRGLIKRSVNTWHITEAGRKALTEIDKTPEAPERGTP